MPSYQTKKPTKEEAKGTKTIIPPRPYALQGGYSYLFSCLRCIESWTFFTFNCP